MLAIQVGEGYNNFWITSPEIEKENKLPKPQHLIISADYRSAGATLSLPLWYCTVQQLTCYRLPPDFAVLYEVR